MDVLANNLANISTPGFKRETVLVAVSGSANLQNTTSRSRNNSDQANLTNFFGLETVQTLGGLGRSPLANSVAISVPIG